MAWGSLESSWGQLSSSDHTNSCCLSHWICCWLFILVFSSYSNNIQSRHSFLLLLPLPSMSSPSKFVTFFSLSLCVCVCSHTCVWKEMYDWNLLSLYRNYLYMDIFRAGYSSLQFLIACLSRNRAQWNFPHSRWHANWYCHCSSLVWTATFWDCMGVTSLSYLEDIILKLISSSSDNLPILSVSI